MRQTPKVHKRKQPTTGQPAIKHRFTQLVLKFTFNQDEWVVFENAYKADPSTIPDEYSFLTIDQWNALGKRDPIKINDEIVKEYYSAAVPQSMDDLVGGIPILIKDWPTHQ
jgi:hypothetical protein